MQALASGRRSLVGAVAALSVWALLASGAHAQLRDPIPSRAYYSGVEQLYRGDYRDALRSFDRAWDGAVRTLGPNGQIRWVDSICYHAMMGETYYHMGQPQAALEQFNFACALFLQYPRWMLRIQFDAQPASATSLGRAVVPWGASERGATLGEVSDTMPVAQGSLDNSSVVQGGGVLTAPQLWPVNVVEIVRCTALAIRRRNEILGPLGPHDEISKNLVLTLSRGVAPPNHWSSAWADLELGFAHAGVGDANQAVACLERATLLAGTLDHPLTGLALLEQGRLALDSGDTDSAAELLAEASYSGFVYEDVGVIDEAFRWGVLNHLASGALGMMPQLPRAADWARRERYSHLFARLNLAMAEQLMGAGDWNGAAAALATAISQLQDARAGIMGNRAAFLEAKGEYHSGRASAPAKMIAALERQAEISLVNFQINTACRKFDDQSLPLRSAPAVFELLLADPTPADAVLRLLESMAVMSTAHDGAFERWLIASLERGNMGAAIEVTDRAKRRRFHNAMPWGGRLATLRNLLASLPGALDPRLEQQRGDLTDQFPEFVAADAAVNTLRAQLQRAWLPGMDDDARRKTTKLWKDYTAARDERELRLGDVALSPVPAEISFPPLLLAPEIQRRLQPGQALLVYHDTPEGMLGFLFSSKSVAQWNCGPSARLATQTSVFLRELGNYDANREMAADVLMSDEWQKASEELAQTLLEGSSLAPSEVAELIVVPDGVVWYVPFEALVAESAGRKAPFIQLTKVRYAPTVGLAFSAPSAWRRVQRTGILAGDLVPGEKPADRAAAVESLSAAVPTPFAIAQPAEAPSTVLATLLDAVIVLAEVDAVVPDPLAWSPLPIDRGAGVGSLEEWLAVPGDGPQRVLLPGMHTLAERGGKAPRRREAGLPGSELFYASCSLMSAGAETALLSRWRVGGQSTLEVMREFVQELPHTPAAEAWQRAVHVLMETPIDPAAELRVTAGRQPVELTGKHPFFWAGYLVVDSGWRPVEDGGDQAAPQEPAAVPGAAPAAAGGAAPTVPAAGQPVPAQPAATGSPAAGAEQPPASPAPPASTAPAPTTAQP